MAQQKFIGPEEVAEILGISNERLNELREAGKLRAYRDGASWKFRSDEVEKMSEQGIPAPDSSISDISLDLGMDDEIGDSVELPAESGIDLELELDDALPMPEEPAAEKPAAPAAKAADESSDLEHGELELGELELSDDDSLAGPTSDIDLGDVDEPTVTTAGASDLNLEEVDEPTVPVDLDDGDASIEQAPAAEGEDDDLSESILLSETEIGGMSDRPPSTIIGKSALGLESDLTPSSDKDKEETVAAQSDVKLVEGSDVLLPSVSDDVLGTEPPSLSGGFDDLEELEIDLEAESSRILSPEDVAKAQAAASDLLGSPKSDIELAATSDIELVGSDDALSIEGSDVNLSGLSALELDDDDDQVLGSGSDSDVTLTSESSGINIISPSDSGLALDEVPLDLAGASPVGSSLDLDAELGEATLEPLELGGDEGDAPAGFELTPLGEEDDGQEKDSSQIIALDDVAEEEAAAPISIGDSADSGMFSEDMGSVGLGVGAGGITAAAAVEPAADVRFSVANIVFLSLCIMLLTLCGMMMYDLLRNMWSWDQMTSLNSTVIDSILNILP